MKKVCLVVILFLSMAFFSSVSIPSASAQSQAIIMPNHTGYFDNSTIPVTYHIVGEVANIGAVTLELLNVTANFYTQDNSLVGSSSAYVLLDVLLPSRKAPFEVAWVVISASQIYNYSLSLRFIEYVGEKPIALQILQNTVYADEAGFLKVNGTVRNLGTFNATATKVNAPFYDSQGRVLSIAHGYTIPSTIMPNNTESFEIELPRKVGSPVNYSITAESTEYEAIGTQVTINYGATYTTATAVTIILLSNDLQSNVTQMRFSNNNATFTTWEPYTTFKSWTLPEGDGIKTVYAQFMDNLNLIAPLYFDTIILDRASPTITIAYPVNASEITSSTVTATWTGFDATSGVNNYEVKLDSSSWINVKSSTTQTFTNLTDGQHIVYVKTTDGAGLSNQESVSFTVTSNPFAPLVLGGTIAIAVVILVVGVAIFVYVRMRKR